MPFSWMNDSDERFATRACATREEGACNTRAARMRSAGNSRARLQSLRWRARTAAPPIDSAIGANRRITSADGQGCASRRSRSALPTTDTELTLIASAAMTGDNSNPVNGYNTPAAIGIPSAL